jgi:hypothetical protein
MRKLVTAILTLFFAVTLTAQNPHLSGPVKYHSPGNPIVITGEIAGLGANQMIQVTCVATVLADSYCISKGSGQITAQLTYTWLNLCFSREFQSDKKGSVTFSFVISNYAEPLASWEGVLYHCHGTQKRVVTYSILGPVDITWQ